MTDGPRMDKKAGACANRFAQMWPERENYLRRARRCASITIPSLFRPWGANYSTDTPAAWQSLGAYLVNSLVSKLTLTEFPPGIPFMRNRMSRQTLQELEKLPADKRAATQEAINQGLAKMDQEFTNGVDEDGDFAYLTSCNTHMVVGGTHGLQFYQDGSMRDMDLSGFTVLRDKQGNTLEFIVEDEQHFQTLPDDVRQIAIANGWFMDNPVESNAQQIVKVYTHGYMYEGKFRVYQECYGATVPGTEFDYKPDVVPFLFPPFKLLPGESYGRSYVEDYEGDIQTIDGNEQTVAEGSAAAARFVQFVKPGGVTSKKALAQAMNGDVITGDAADVAVLDNSKATANFSSAETQIVRKAELLNKAFLVTSAIIRNAERVTAEEIKMLAQELQDALGSTYAQQVPQFQRPYGLRKMASLQRQGRMLAVRKDLIRTVIVTGAAALSRNAEIAALDSLIPPVTNPLAALAPKIIKPAMWFNKRATALGLDADALVLKPEEYDAMVQQEQQSAMAAQMGPEMIKQGGNLMSTGMKAQSDQAIAAQQAQQQQPPPGGGQAPPPAPPTGAPQQ